MDRIVQYYGAVLFPPPDDQTLVLVTRVVLFCWSLDTRRSKFPGNSFGLQFNGTLTCGLRWKCPFLRTRISKPTESKVAGMGSIYFPSGSLSSVIQSCLTLCNPMDCSTPGFPVHHQLPELAQTHVHRVGDAIQLSHPLSSPSPPAFNLSQYPGLFQ